MKIFKHFISNNDISDLHIRTGLNPQYRKSGFLMNIADISKLTAIDVYTMIAVIFQQRYDSDISTLIKDFKINGHELDLAITIPDSNYRARVNVFKSMGEPCFVMRKIPEDIPKLIELGFNTKHYEFIKKYSTYKEGLILVTGQTGSGKSTTLASIINDINENKSINKHIITIEDPVEFVHHSKHSIITHREVGENSDTSSFANGLRASLREDPDIILVGEIRDALTAEAALIAAKTGHLVFATLHTNSSAETVSRFLDMFSSEQADSIRVSLGQNLRLVLSQRLVPTIKGKRVLAYEFLHITPIIANVITTDKLKFMNTIQNELHNGYSEGQLSMNRSLYNLFEKDGIISKEIAEEYSSNREEFNNLLTD